MSNAEVRAYTHPHDYYDLSSLLMHVGMYDPDYESEARLADFSTRQPEGILVAVVESQVVGAIYVVDAVIPELHRLAVLERYRRKGIGSLLVNEAEVRLQELGHTHFEVQVDADNSAGLAFWEGRGLSRGGFYRNMYKLIGGPSS